MGVISTPHVSLSDQLADIFKKSIIGVSYDCLGSKLGMFDLYSPTMRGSVTYSSLEGLRYNSL